MQSKNKTSDIRQNATEELELLVMLTMFISMDVNTIVRAEADKNIT